MNLPSHDEILTTQPNKKDLPKLVELFKKTDSNILRNDLAMIISDLKGDSFLPEMIKVLNRKSITNKGTIIYAISKMNSSHFIMDISTFLLSHNFEVALEAINFIMQFKKQANIQELFQIKTILLENKNTILPKNIRKNLLRGLNYEIKKRRNQYNQCKT